MNSNFTTIEQSNRLLEFRLPKNSADLYYNKFGALEAIPEYRNFNEFCDTTDTPCWSVGRLQEIAKISAKEKEYYYASLDCVGHQDDFVEWWVKHFTLTDNVLFDFSKLEGR